MVPMNVIGKLLLAVLTATMSSCGVYRPPSGHGYDYDRGRTMARSDVGVNRYVYYARGVDATRLASLSLQVEANCGFLIKYAYGDPPADIRVVEFAKGYNSVSVPAIEKRLKTNISEAIRRCLETDEQDTKF